MNTLFRSLLPALGTLLPLASLIPAAQAADHVYHLSGDLAAGLYVSNAAGIQGFIPLTNDDSANGELPAIVLSTGDTLTATIRFDKAISLPPSDANPQPYAADFGLKLQDYDPATAPGGTTLFYSSSFRFFLGGSEVFPGPSAEPDGGCGNILCVDAVYIPATQALRFDSVEVSATLDGFFFTPGIDLGTVSTLVTPHGEFSYFVAASAPEPASWAMLLLGFAALGGRALRRTHRSA
jgi:hypothetical protein